MGNKKLSAIITIGGTVSSSLGAAFGAIKAKTGEVGGAIQKLTERQRELNSVIAKAGRDGQRGSELRLQYAQQELDMIGKQVAALKRRQQIETKITDLKSKFQSDFIGRSASAMALGGIARIPLKDFEELDAAMNNMEVAFMSKGGGLPSQIAEVKKQTIELGNALPGTTADFVNLATALKEQGAPMEAIVGGALKSAAHLGVVMKMMPEQAGEMVAKLRESFALGDSEFSKMADYAQRARFGFGLKSEDLLLGSKYYGGKLNTLGITGADNVRKVFALQGMAAQQGMDGSTFGTNFGQMLTRLGTMTDRLNKSSKEMRHVNAMLKESGITLKFFDKGGKFAGVDNMVEQLGKLGKLTQEKRLQVLFRLFGEEGSRPADLIARTGIEGFRKALERMDSEASLDERIGKSVTSFRNRLEALGGTITNLLAAVGAPLAKMLDPILVKMNEIVGGPLQKWVEDNPTIVKGIGIIVGSSAMLFAVGAAFSAIGFASTVAASGLLSAGGALQFVGSALLWVGRALFMNPIGLAVAAIAGAAYLIYKNWEPIKAFFINLWDGVKSAFNTALEWIIGKIEWVGQKWQQFKAFLGMGEEGGQAAAPAAKGSLPPVPPPAARGGTTVNDNSTTTVNVHQQPGQDSKALADEVARRLAERQGVRRRSSLVDGVGAQ